MGMGYLLCHEGVSTPVSLFLFHSCSQGSLQEKFGEHVQRMHADRDKWFEMEYTVSESTKSQCKIVFV